MNCPVCGQQHQSEWSWGDLPIVVCPSMPPGYVLVGDERAAVIDREPEE